MDLENTLYDIAIVGGGLAGNSLGLALNNHGLNIAIIEANTREEQANSPAGDRALALAAGTVAILNSLGAWQAVSAKATAIKDIHVSDRGHFGKVRLSACKEKVEALGYVITAHDIESHLANLVENTSIARICPARLVGLASEPNHVNVSLIDHGKSIKLRSKLLVGADGGNSSVRTLLGIDQQCTDYNQTALVTTVKATLPHQNTAYERFTESGPLALLPIGKHDCSVVWTRTKEDAEALMAWSEEEFTQALQDCFGFRLGKLTLSAPRRAFPLSLIRAQKMHSGRVVLIGNAVHQLHPVAGQGFNLGLRDVQQLSDLILARHKSTEDIGDPDFLENYVAARQRDHSQTIAFTDSLVKLFSNTMPALTLARNIGLATLDHLPFAKSLLSRHAMGLTQHLPNTVNQ
jgi:2-octaprenyl-6-methoxyphenol hydroxylase